MITLSAFLVLMLIGVPIGLLLCLSAVTFAVSTGNTVLLESYLLQLYGGIDSYGLIAFPLFLLVGELMSSGGITQRLIAMSSALLGSVRGGLAYINVLANAILASILGSASAQIAIMSKVIVPEMERRGYDKAFSVGLTASAGLLGPIIPPSIMFVVYGVMAEVSIGDMFLAGIIPGLLLAGGFILTIAAIGFVTNLPREPYQTLRERAQSVAHGIPALLIPLVIIGGISAGIASPTESAALAAVASYAVAWFYGHRIRLADLKGMLLRTALNTGLILYLVAAANVFTWVLIYGQVPQTVASWIQSVATGPVSFMLWVNIILLVIGTVIDGIPGLILAVPILFPIATNVYGIDPIQFGVVVCINLVLGLVSPPVGIALFIAAQAAKMRPGDIFVASLPFCLVTCLILVLLSVFPWFTLALVR